MGNDNQALKGVLAVVVLGLVIGGVVFFTREDTDTSVKKETANTTEVVQQNNESTATQQQPAQQSAEANEYKNGSYKATGSYTSPGGNENITVNLTLADGKITEVSLENGAGHPTSSRFQDDFIEAVASAVSGVNLDDADIDDLAGSSLTGAGFNKALDDIRSQAKS